MEDSCSDDVVLPDITEEDSSSDETDIQGEGLDFVDKSEDDSITLIQDATAFSSSSDSPSRNTFDDDIDELSVDDSSQITPMVVLERRLRHRTRCECVRGLWTGKHS